MSVVTCWHCPLQFRELAIFACASAAVLFLAMLGWLRTSGVIKFVAGLVMAIAAPFAALALVGTIRFGVVWREPWLNRPSIPLTITGIALALGTNAAALLAAAWLSRSRQATAPTSAEQPHA